ncbi:MAG: radical SAM protein [Sedimentisphaerales bacterium]|nr:radical SAM protein [Sedimentisphaerales bacterium]
MKILLIDPPFYRFIGYYNRYFPLGLSYLAAVLQQAGHDVLIYDADCNIEPDKMDFSCLEDYYPVYLHDVKDNSHPVWRQFSSTLNDFKPDIVGITAWTTFAASSFTVAAICKQYNKDMPVVFGGPHATIKYDEIMKICPDVDIIVKGEGEKTFPELVRSMQCKKQIDRQTLKNIKGIAFRQDGQIINNPNSEFIQDLDTLPLPAREFLLNKDKYDSEDMGLMMTSRGCPYNCAYCATSIWKRKIRYRSVDNVINEIKFVRDRYGTRQFTFKDDSFTVSKKRVLQICDRLINENIDINWDCNTRVNLIDDELLAKMKKAGCNSIKVGIETGSERILKLINKGTTLDQARRAAKLLRNAGIHWTGYFMMGLPTETKEETYQTLQFMKELKPDFASLSVYEPFPGTDLFELGIEKGLVERERTLEDFYTISPKYYYVKDAGKRVDTMTNNEFEQLETEMKNKFHKYNMGFSKLLKRARSRSRIYISEPKALCSDFKKFLSWVS